MLMKPILIAAALAALACAQPASDPQPPTPPAVVAQFLGLSDAQTTRFQQLLQAVRAAVPPLAQQAAAQQQALEQLLTAAQPDPAAVGRALLAIRAIQNQIQQAVQTYRGSFTALLTADQQQKLQAVTQAAQLIPAVQVFAASLLVDAPH
jgi:uncharacterized membrane protein